MVALSGESLAGVWTVSHLKALAMSVDIRLDQGGDPPAEYALV
jgi:hypothetical protein